MRIPQSLAIGRRHDGERTGHEEADRAPGIRSPSALARQRPCSTAVSSAAMVLRLKNRVPTNCTAAAHQSARSERDEPRRGGRRPLSASWMKAARVKKTAPTKNVASVGDRTDGVGVERHGAEGEEHRSDRESPCFPCEGGRCVLASWRRAYGSVGLANVTRIQHDARRRRWPVAFAHDDHTAQRRVGASPPPHSPEPAIRISSTRCSPAPARRPTSRSTSCRRGSRCPRPPTRSSTTRRCSTATPG